jgi:two-component system NtrC family sensor kinase
MIISLFVLVLSYYSHYVLNQKLQLIEKKDTLFNIILEARRYEKNYFLSLDRKHVKEAISYVNRAKESLNHITEEYGKYTLVKNFEEMLIEILRYEKSLTAFLLLHQSDGSLKVDMDTIDNLESYRNITQKRGRKITTDFEDILRNERIYVQSLIEKSKIYHVIALASLFVLSVLTTLFLIINVNRPLKSIEDAVFQIAQGQYEKIPQISTGDEFESLVESLNMMIDELNKRNEQIIQTEKLASLGTLTSGVAHELNNPLNNISTSIQILLEEIEVANPEYKKELLMESEKQVERARDTVKALLEFSRDRGFSPESVNFKDLVDQTIKLVKAEIPTSIELETSIPDDLQTHIDPQRIQQVLINLIINAIQAMENGGKLNINTYILKNGKEFCFQVEDTGNGIPKKYMRKIFDPFFTTKAVGVGTGLGLSTSHGIIEQHGGQIKVKSEPDKGTIFTVSLPI